MNFLSSCYLLGLEPDTEFTKDSRSIQLGAQSPWTKPSPPAEQWFCEGHQAMGTYWGHTDISWDQNWAL